MKRLLSSFITSSLFLSGGTAIADPIINSGTSFGDSPSFNTIGNTVNPGPNAQYTLTSDFDCATGDVMKEKLMWLCINELSGSSGGTDSATTTLINTNTSNITTNKNNINNLGEGVANATALTAALTALPQASTDSKFSCGIGTGAYSSSYALGVGCASKVNERVDVNFGGSYVGGGSKDYGSGSLDTVAARAGFVFKLGKVEESPLQAARKAAKLHDLVANVHEENKTLRDKNLELIARLERLESIALGDYKSETHQISLAN